MLTSRSSYAEIEIRILAKHAAGYPVEMTLDDEQEFPPGVLDPGLLPWAASTSPADDGQRLFRWLFADPKLLAAWAEARGQNAQRRIRLRIDADAPELHALPWELLLDSSDAQAVQSLAAASATPFSRYLAGRWQPGNPILQRPIKVLVAIASPDPKALEPYGLAKVDVAAEWDALQSALAGLDAKLVLLCEPCTLTALEAELRKGYHVLHFVGHGAFDARQSQAQLFLADDQNQVKLATDQELAEMLARQLADTDARSDDKLRLVFLASCQTAARSPADAYRGLAPRLVTAGVPAVVAMQDLVPMDTARLFAGTFYKQLLNHGMADLACNEARSAILTANLPGAAIPVLFMRLRNGQLLGQRGQILGDRAEGFWATLLENIADGECTPFLGPGVTAGLLPSPVEIAQRLAEEYNYPFPATESLPRVAQFVGTLDNRRLRKEIVRAKVAGFTARMGRKADPADRQLSLDQLVASVGWPNGQQIAEGEMHQQMAELNLPLFVTTNSDSFMTRALQAKNPAARRETVKWREPVSQGAARPHFDLDPPPSPATPVVLHLFGTDDDLLSMVLTEDDYLDYLARISRDYEYLLPTSVQDALASTTLLFLGYRLEDLDLKVILRGLLSNLDLERWGMLHVAVQIEAETADQARQQEVTRFFQRYFANSKIDVYWGSTQQFIADLHARWQEYQQPGSRDHHE